MQREDIKNLNRERNKTKSGRKKKLNANPDVELLFLYIRRGFQQGVDVLWSNCSPQLINL